MKMLVFRYQSIDIYCIVLPVECDGGLSISVLRNKQLFKENGRQKFTFSGSSDFEKLSVSLYFTLRPFQIFVAMSQDFACQSLKTTEAHLKVTAKKMLSQVRFLWTE
jgi:hypothetical protein